MEKAKQKYLFSCRWMEPEQLMALSDLSIIAALWGAASRWEYRCVKSEKIIFLITFENLQAKPPGLWVHAAGPSIPKKKL